MIQRAFFRRNGRRIDHETWSFLVASVGAALVIVTATACTGSASEGVAGAPDATAPISGWSIHVDQFGYRPADPKVAVIAGPDGGDPSLPDRVEVRRWDTHEVVHTGSIRIWRGGATDPQSGDRGGWFDFSAVDAPGSYYLASGDEITTGRFEIGEAVHDEVLDAALRAFWFNRANIDHPRSLAGPWNDDAAYVGEGQDREARSIDAPDDPDSARDLSGGWFDAGDPNKYVTFASEPVHQLLTAYQRSPDVFGDDVGIPESGNGIPDVLDEIRWEIDWLERMQNPDGAVLSKVGITEWGWEGLPSDSPLPRFYEEACSSSTIAAAAMFAHAANVFEDLPALAGDAERLTERAESAWRWYRSNERREDCDPQIIKAGDADQTLLEQSRDEVTAAIYLLERTGESIYGDVIRDGLGSTLLFEREQFGRYAPDQADALLRYRTLPNAHSDTVAEIDRRLSELVATSSNYGFDPDAGLYRAFMPDEQFHWGSNRVMANLGSANLALAGVPNGYSRALAHLHYFHGVNPLGLVYLSNMGALGAERSVSELFHFWFGEQTFTTDTGADAGVVPGFVVGGPNRDYTGRESPPAGQPPMRSYHDLSADTGDPVWEVTEPAIYYQAAYVSLLAAVIAEGP